jgi:hypothetical protein
MWKQLSQKELKLNDVQNAKAREDEIEITNKKLKILSFFPSLSQYERVYERILFIESK